MDDEYDHGLSQAERTLMNAAVAALVERGFDESAAYNFVADNWKPTGNTVESLTQIGEPIAVGARNVRINFAPDDDV